MFMFLLALGEDYNILVMTGSGRRPSVLRSAQAVSAGAGAHRLDGDLGRAGPGRHVRRVRLVVGGRSPGGGQFRDVLASVWRSAS